MRVRTVRVAMGASRGRTPFRSEGVPGTAGMKEVARRSQLLLNGNNVAMLVPGGRPSSAAA